MTLGMALLKQCRPWHWTKNLLVWLPILLSHEYLIVSWTNAFLAFAGWCFMASAVYVFNDLIDLERDKHHPSKSRRPLAAGVISVETAKISFGVLMAAGLLVASSLGPAFLGMLLLYLFLNYLYSFSLKGLRFFDLFVLTSFYFLRITSGLLLISSPPTFWLISAAVLLFFGFSCFKRTFDLDQCRKGRGYKITDGKILKRWARHSWIILGLVVLSYALGPMGKVSYGRPWILSFSLIPLLITERRIQSILAKPVVGKEEFLELLLKDPVLIICIISVFSLVGLAL